jgi:hypothetical protein
MILINSLCADTWDEIQTKGDRVDWYNLIRFPLVIPKQTFIGWVAMHNKLSTKARLLKWGSSLDSHYCVFCKFSMKDTDHLFFQCSFT